jgi:hypothetical protein
VGESGESGESRLVNVDECIESGESGLAKVGESGEYLPSLLMIVGTRKIGRFMHK